MTESAGAGRDAEAVSKFVESFAAQLVEAGMQRMAARVFAALLASDKGVLKPGMPADAAIRSDPAPRR